MCRKYYGQGTRFNGQGGRGEGLKYEGQSPERSNSCARDGSFGAKRGKAKQSSTPWHTIVAVAGLAVVLSLFLGGDGDTAGAQPGTRSSDFRRSKLDYILVFLTVLRAAPSLQRFGLLVSNICPL